MNPIPERSPHAVPVRSLNDDVTGEVGCGGSRVEATPAVPACHASELLGPAHANVAQLEERRLAKAEATGSNPVVRSAAVEATAGGFLSSLPDGDLGGGGSARPASSAALAVGAGGPPAEAGSSDPHAPAGSDGPADGQERDRPWWDLRAAWRHLAECQRDRVLDALDDANSEPEEEEE